jgi:hypothetical protein
MAQGHISLSLLSVEVRSTELR